MGSLLRVMSFASYQGRGGARIRRRVGVYVDILLWPLFRCSLKEPSGSMQFVELAIFAARELGTGLPKIEGDAREPMNIMRSTTRSV